jgi:hypothetical protein
MLTIMTMLPHDPLQCDDARCRCHRAPRAGERPRPLALVPLSSEAAHGTGKDLEE